MLSMWPSQYFLWQVLSPNGSSPITCPSVKIFKCIGAVCTEFSERLICGAWCGSLLTFLHSRLRFAFVPFSLQRWGLFILSLHLLSCFASASPPHPFCSVSAPFGCLCTEAGTSYFTPWKMANGDLNVPCASLRGCGHLLFCTAFIPHKTPALFLFSFLFPHLWASQDFPQIRVDV